MARLLIWSEILAIFIYIGDIPAMLYLPIKFPYVMPRLIHVLWEWSCPTQYLRCVLQVTLQIIC